MSSDTESEDGVADAEEGREADDGEHGEDWHSASEDDNSMVDDDNVAVNVEPPQGEILYFVIFSNENVQSV